VDASVAQDAYRPIRLAARVLGQGNSNLVPFRRSKQELLLRQSIGPIHREGDRYGALTGIANPHVALDDIARRHASEIDSCRRDADVRRHSNQRRLVAAGGKAERPKEAEAT